MAGPTAATAPGYAVYRDGRLVPVGRPGAELPPLQEFIHDQLRALILSRRFSCVGAKAAIQRGSYALGCYGELGSPDSAEQVRRDLAAFVRNRQGTDPLFTSFIAAFTGPAIAGEPEFEALLWRHLQAMHEIDRHTSTWDPSVSSDPADPNFAFSVAGTAHFVVGLHPASSRWSRRFAWPTLVFNRHDQFEQLRAGGRYDALQRAIRRRDIELQGSTNPMLTDFGVQSEARQYAGRPVNDAWTCPFQQEGEERSEP